MISLFPGRQLFVDGHLIESATLRRVWHNPVPYEHNPVLFPETEPELNQGIAPVATVFNDGCWFDPADGRYKLFYNAGWYPGPALAVSDDAVHWTRPELDNVPGTNLLIRSEERRLRNGSLCWLDLHAENPAERWKMFLYYRYPSEKREGGVLFTSSDGIHWNERIAAGPCGDNSSFFHDPFRSEWCFSIRDYTGDGRVRRFERRKEFIAPPWERIGGPVLKCDPLDKLEHPEPSIGNRPQLYDFNAAPYESLLLGVAAVFEGPENDVCFELGRPKTIHLHYAFSRDGISWSRTDDRKPFLRCTGQVEDWDRGYLHSAGGISLVFEDHLRFYYGGWSGKSTLGPEQSGKRRDECAVYASGSVGFATLRRDGFASMNAQDGGELLTKPFAARGKTLWINASAKNLRAELTDESGKTISGYSLEECRTFSGDSVKTRIIWQNRAGLPDVPVIRIRFQLKHGELYSFWTSNSESGHSGGYLAAGSADYKGDMDS